MQIYTKYVSAKKMGEELINEKMKSSIEFAGVVNRAINGAENGDFIMKKLLLLPMQRLTQYSLLIDKVYLSSNLLNIFREYFE